MAEGKFTNLGDTMKIWSEKIVFALRDRLDKDKSNASHTLWQSIKFPVSIYGTAYVMELSMNKYWKWVDEGRKPGKMPPVDDIIKWTSQKGLDIGKLSDRRKKRLRNVKNKTVKKAYKQISNDALRRQLAFLIARKIAKYGTKGTHFYTETMTDEFEAAFKADIIKATKKDIIININKGLPPKK